MDLPGRKKMNAITFDRKGFEVDHVTASTIYKNADFIISMTMWLLRFMGILPVLNDFARDLIHVKSDFFIAFRKFVNVNVFEHFISRNGRKDN